MSTVNYRAVRLIKPLIATAVAAALLAACAVTPAKPDGAAAARDKLTQLQSDPNLASRAPLAMKDADSAVRAAEQPQSDPQLGEYRVYIAERKVATARAQAETSFAEDQRGELSAQRESARLNARTREANVARSQAATARAEGVERQAAADRARNDADTARSQAAVAQAQGVEQQAAADRARNDAETARSQAATAQAQGLEQQAAADRARNDADTARSQAVTARAEGVAQKAAADRARNDADAASLSAVSSQQQAAELQRQIDVLHARPTDRGLVLTLGDVLFMSGRSDLKAGAAGHLSRLVAFLNAYPNRTVVIQGYTDSVGNEASNQRLSERRADSVKAYLAEQGIGSMRLSASGKGQSDPVAGNDTPSGRQQNRRVEVIISNPPAAMR